MISAGQIGPADRAGEQGVADEQVLAGAVRCTDLQTDAPGTVARRVMRYRDAITKANRLSRRVEVIDRRLRLNVQPEHPAHFDGPLVQEEVVAMERHLDAERPLRGGHSRHMVDVRVRQQNVVDRQRLILRDLKQLVDFVAGINEHGVAGAATGDDEAVLEERLDGSRLDYDHDVILAILDDLMFTSKIRAAAAQLGVAVSFARSSQAALADMRTNQPALVILDLNNPRTDPLGTVGAMKSDPALAQIPTVGFASHVQTDVIAAARQAGVDEVMARSAFTQQLPDILGRVGRDQ